ncbi:hypothetical protein CRE_22585 [Caenorhabditis remanei]|uniref:Uncharacterized protein n=1 Tax=Caenorhabditis remanei TaxID=31234 RepID=E3N375_CAERE|nr:hypothetical protein CRE_22585 [Caenorhabditis remanei]
MSPRPEDDDLVIEPADDEGLHYGNASNRWRACGAYRADSRGLKSLATMSAVFPTRSQTVNHFESVTKSK